MAERAAIVGISAEAAKLAEWVKGAHGAVAYDEISEWAAG